MTNATRASRFARLAVTSALATALAAVGLTPAHAATYDTVTLTVQTTNIPAGETVELGAFNKASTGAAIYEAEVGATGVAVFENVPTGLRYSLEAGGSVGSQVHLQSLGGGQTLYDGTRFDMPNTSATRSLRFDAVRPAWVTGKVTGSAEALANGAVRAITWSDVSNSWLTLSTAELGADGTYRLPVQPRSRFFTTASSTATVGGEQTAYVTAYPRGRVELPTKDDTGYTSSSPASGGTVVAQPLALTTLTARLSLTIAGLGATSASSANVALTSLNNGSKSSQKVYGNSPSTTFHNLVPGRYVVTAQAVGAPTAASAILDLSGSRAATLTLTEPTGALYLSTRLEGIGQVGQVQTMRTSLRSRVPGASVTTTWNSDNKVLATGSQYRLTPTDLHSFVRVVVLATAPGYVPAVAVSAVGYGKLGDAPRVTAAPRISGNVAVGQTISVAKGSWDVPNVSVAAQWTRNGVAIPGATSTSYVVTPADAGRQIDVVLTAWSRGHATGSVVVTGVTAALGARVAFKARVSGTPKVGRTFTATAAPAGWNASYRWYRSGKAIKGATQRTYKATSSDVGRTLKVKVTLTRAGYSTTTAASASTKKIARATASLSAKAGKRKATITVRATGITSPTGTLTIRYGTTTKRVRLASKHRGKVTVKLPKGRYTVKISYSGSSSISKTSRSVKLTVR